MPNTSAPSNSAERTRASLGLFAACALWGLSFPLSKALSQAALSAAPALSTWFVAAVVLSGRFVLAALVLLVLRPATVTRSELAQGAGLGVFLGLGVLLQMDGLNYTEASTSAFLTQGYVVILPLVALVAERRLPSGRVLCAVAMVLGGLWILSRFELEGLKLGRGEAETLLAAVFFAFQILWLDRKSFARNRSGPVTVVMFATAGVLLGLFAAASGAGSARDFSAVLGMPAAWPCFAALTLLCTLAAFWLMNELQTRLSPSEAGVIYCAEPLFASLFALFLPGLLAPWFGFDYRNEVPTARLLVGGGLVTLANVLLQLGPRRVALASGSALGRGNES